MTRPARVVASGWGWRHAGRRAWAVRGLDLVIEPGERVLLLGASGAGKSTLLQGLAGVLGGDEEGESEGELLIDGAPAHTLRGHAGLVLQDPDSQVILARVGDEIAFGCENLGVPRDEIWRRVAEALDAVGLRVGIDHPTKALSGGQKQRLALASALAMRPGLLLLDEPTANLDPAGIDEVRSSVARVAAEQGSTLVIVEHRVQTWIDVVTRVVVLGEHGVIADGDPRSILDREGARLAAGGVWVPGIVPPSPPAPHAPGDELLRATDLAVRRVRGAQVVASGIELAVRAGAALAVTGPNGAGKSTLGLTIAGLLPAASGTVHARTALAGDAGADPIRWSSKQLLTRIGSVFQEPEHQLLSRTVREELEVGPRALGAVGPRRIDELLERLRLAHLAAANPFTLSGGEKRRLTVAAALATRPRVLVLDEPTFGQDARTWCELVALLVDVRDSGVGLVTVTHDADVVRALRAKRFELPGGAA